MQLHAMYTWAFRLVDKPLSLSGLGLPWKQTNASGVTLENSYDDLNRIANLKYTNANNLQLANFSYGYTGDLITNITAAQYWPGIGNRTRVRDYGYDKVNRLTSESRSAGGQMLWRRAYEYDAAGNRKKLHAFDGSSTTTLNFTYNDFNQLTSGEGLSWGEDIYPPVYDYAYDSNGNLVEQWDSANWIDQVYQHDRHNRLTGYGGDEVLNHHYYDFSGRLLRSCDSSNEDRWTYYYYDGINTLLTKQTSDEGNCMRTVSAYVLKAAPIGQVLQQRWYSYEYTEECDISYATPHDTAYMYDHIGNIIGLADMSPGGATVRAASDMEAFGKAMEGFQGLTGKDSHGGLYYFGARWYDPGTASWVEQSPLPHFIESPYGFAYGSPTFFVDTDGQLAFVVPAVIGGVVGGALGYWGNRHGTPCERAAGAGCGMASGAISGALLGGSTGTLMRNVIRMVGGRPVAGALGGAIAGGYGLICKSPCEAFVDAICGAADALHGHGNQTDAVLNAR